MTMDKRLVNGIGRKKFSTPPLQAANDDIPQRSGIGFRLL